MNALFDVIIVGAGLAGLQAATSLAAAGKKVVLLEEKQRVGGRVYAAPIVEGSDPVDWGAEWIIPHSHKRLLALVERFGLTMESENASLCWNVPGLRQTVHFEDMLQQRPSFRKTLDAVQSWFDGGYTPEDDEISLKTLLERLTDDPTDIALTEAVFFPLTGADPADVSARSIREEIRVHGNSLELTINADTKRFSECAGSIPEKMAAELPEGILKTGMPVRRIEPSTEGVCVSGDGFSLNALHVLVAVPAAALGRIEFAEALKMPDASVSDHLNAGRVTKLWAIAKGECPPAHFQVGTPLRLIYTWERGNELLICAQALDKDLDGSDLKELFRSALPHLQIIAAKAESWTQNPEFLASWMTAAPGPYPADLFAYEKEPVDVIGGDVAHEWVGWMEGALASAERAVNRLLGK